MRLNAHHYALIAFLISTVWVEAAQSRPFRRNQIPNGWVNGCKNCHAEDGAGGARNPFGTLVEMQFLSVPGPDGDVLWGPALAVLDADGDGRTNGEELLDPNGTWAIGQTHPGDPLLVTLPGHNDVAPAPVAAPVLPPAGVALTVVSLLGVGVARLRRRAASF